MIELFYKNSLNVSRESTSELYYLMSILWRYKINNLFIPTLLDSWKLDSWWLRGEKGPHINCFKKNLISFLVLFCLVLGTLFVDWKGRLLSSGRLLHITIHFWWMELSWNGPDGQSAHTWSWAQCLYPRFIWVM